MEKLSLGVEMKIKEKDLRNLIEQALRIDALIKEDVSAVQTVGDLKALINAAIRKKKFKTAAKSGVEAVLDFVPGLGVTKSVGSALKALYSLPDSSRPKGPLGNLDVDDDVGKIVDDSIENKFLNDLSSELESMGDDTPLTDLNMTKLLATFIGDEFNRRTVSGF